MSNPAIDLDMLANDIADVLADDFYQIDIGCEGIKKALINSNFVATLQQIEADG